MSHHTFNFTGFFSYARFTGGSYFAMEKLDVRCKQD